MRPGGPPPAGPRGPRQVRGLECAVTFTACISRMTPDADTAFAPPTPAADGPGPAWPPSVAAVFDTRPAAVAVVVKRKRLLLKDDRPGAGAADQAPAEDGERRPRVFVLPSEPRAEAPAPSQEPVAVEAAPRALRRRQNPVQRPGKVVVIVPPPELVEVAADADAEAAVDETWLVLPSHSDYEAVRASLEHVKALLRDAAAASRFRFGR